MLYFNGHVNKCVPLYNFDLRVISVENSFNVQCDVATEYEVNNAVSNSGFENGVSLTAI
jgi:hypothetical protein